MSFIRNASQCIYFGLTSTTGVLDQTGNFGLNRSRDNDAQASCTGNLVNKGSGQFVLVSSSDDLNGRSCGFLFTAPGCSAFNLTIRTQDSTQICDANVVRFGGVAGTFSGGMARALDVNGNVLGSVQGNIGGNVAGSVAGNLGGNVLGNVNGNVGGTVGSVVGAVGSVAGNVNGNVLGSVQGNIGGTLAVVGVGAIGATSLTAAALNAIADALLDRNMATGADSGSESIRTARQALRFNRNKVDATTGEVFKEDDTTASWTFALTRAAGNPVTIIDPTD